MYQARFDYSFNPNWRWHVLYEGLAPGDFYRVASGAYFLRFEMSYQITGKLPAPAALRK
jgi:hypothetical protein